MSKLTIKNFDDVVNGDEGKWSQICSECAHKFRLTDNSFNISDIPTDSSICGVKDCNNIAEYYIDFKEE